MNNIVPTRGTNSVVTHDLTSYEGVSPIEATFIIEYIKTGDSAKAYATAFGVPLSQECVDYGARLLKKADVKEAVNKQIAARVNIALATDETIISEMIQAASFDPSEIYDEKGGIKSITELPPHVTKFIKGIAIKRQKEKIGRNDYIEHEIVQLQFVDKLKALETLFKHRNLVKGDTKPNHLTQINIYDSKIENLSPQAREELVEMGLIIDNTDPIGTREVAPIDFSDALDADFTEIVYDDTK